MDMWEKYERDSKILDDYYDKIIKDTSLENLKKLYQFMKKIAPEYYQDDIRYYVLMNF